MSSFTAFFDELDDWCGTRVPGQPPRPPWLKDALSAVVISELATRVDGETARALNQVVTRLNQSVAEQVQLNPQPLPPN